LDRRVPLARIRIITPKCIFSNRVIPTRFSPESCSAIFNHQRVVADYKLEHAKADTKNFAILNIKLADMILSNLVACGTATAKAQINARHRRLSRQDQSFLGFEVSPCGWPSWFPTWGRAKRLVLVAVPAPDLHAPFDSRAHRQTLPRLPR